MKICQNGTWKECIRQLIAGIREIGCVFHPFPFPCGLGGSEPELPEWRFSIGNAQERPHVVSQDGQTGPSHLPVQRADGEVFRRLAQGSAAQVEHQEQEGGRRRHGRTLQGK